jgi:Flp pilus assembly pilin Flp
MGGEGFFRKHLSKYMGKGVRRMIDIRRVWTDFLKDESGMGVVEIILIIVVLIAMVLVFKEQITTLVNNIWKSINQSAKKIY